MPLNIQQEVQAIKQLLETKTRIVITSHHNPDGDAIGSMLGLYFVLKEMCVNTSMVLPNDIPEFLAWLPGSNDVVRFSKDKKRATELITSAEVLFALDYNGPSRLETLKEIFEKSPAVKILIDHHPFPEPAFHHSISVINVSSTAELVYEFALQLGGSHLVNYNAAINIFVGIMTDTGSFSYACSNPRTFQVVSELLNKGVSVEEAQQQVYNNFSEGRMRLLGHSLSTKMKVFPEHRAAYIALSREELKSFNYAIGDTEGLVNYPLSIKNIIFSALFVENTNHIKISLRSSGKFPANKISEEFFNGGGHLNAAGGKSFTTLDETEKQFVAILDKYKEELNR